MSTKIEFYEFLSVSRDATPEQIKKAYKKMAIANHPDRNPGDEEAIERFKTASEAYEVLSDENKRSRYDRYGHAGLSGLGGGGGAGAGFQDVSDIFDAFGDLFDGFGFAGAGGGRRGGGGARPRKGSSLRTSIKIDLHEAAAGCTRTLDVDRNVECKTCHGSGAEPGSSPETCDYCGGHGKVVQSQGFFRVQTTCPACRGVGQTIRDKCNTCHGSGHTSQTDKLELNVPAGIDDGMQLCLRGEGEAGKNGGPAGDLYVDIHLKPHRIFERHDKDLFCRIPITYTQATLGSDLEVPTLSGAHTLTIPAATQPNEQFRLKGMGMPDVHGRRSGDIVVEVQVEVPQKLTERQEELLRELAELENKHVSPHRKTFFASVKDYFASFTTSDE
ncbi:Chaperone protein DnaJ [Polystyrenella longa]|uniref:Chaperone protein DnaJ n=1 Tax=Polystyrenella longa TaxID=2528007 RepID=A0A518CJ70_9PLAN|nr:molecular chaperone DnaJ [Polystyrenella longa]QDU79272.1 Chaperone protein DnaJ [Polystyrenella longa]